VLCWSFNVRGMRPAVWLSYATGVAMAVPVIVLAVGPFVTGNISNHAVNGNAMSSTLTGVFGESASTWHQRAERADGSELHRLESRLEESLGNLDAAVDAARRDVAAATMASNAVRIAAAGVRLAGLLERQRRVSDAEAALREVADKSLLAGRPELRLELLLNRMTLMERAGILDDEERWSSGLGVRALLQRSRAVTSNTALVRLLAAALGREEPGRIREAVRLVGLGHDEDTERVNALVAELAAWDAAGSEPGQLARASGLQVADATKEDITRAWTALAGLGTDAGLLLDRLWNTAAPPERVREALRMIYVWWGVPSDRHEATMAEPMQVLTEYPLDWSRPETKELEDIVLTGYPSPVDMQGLANRAGLNPGMISWASSNRRITRELLDTASAAGRVDSLVEAVLDDPETTSVHGRMRSLVGENWLQARNLSESGDT
jgi:hypothetical protein